MRWGMLGDMTHCYTLMCLLGCCNLWYPDLSMLGMARSKEHMVGWWLEVVGVVDMP